jgi:predicted  nucleic acid-binding Zn-ribbon protein
MDVAHALIDLQERDLTLLRLNRQLDEMPEKRAILAARTRLVEIKALKTRSEAAARAIAADVKRAEDDLQAVTATMEAEQGKLLSGAVKAPKELQAISHELDSLKRRADRIEGDLLAKLQKREDATAQAAKIDAAINAGERVEAELTSRFKEHGGELLTAIETENRARAVLLDAIPTDIRGRYESIRDSHHGIGVGVLNDEAMCSACRVTLPAGKVDALNAGPDVGTCPNCNRLLIVRRA